MSLVYAEMPLSEIILNEPLLIPVINRFGIILGTKDKSVQTLCQENNLDTDFFLTILNTFINDSFFPEKRLKSFCVTQIVDYLSQTNQYYKRYQIPNIEKHFGLLKHELLKRIEDDQQSWFPKIKRLSANVHSQIPGFSLTSFLKDDPDPIEEKLNDLKSFFVLHLTGKYDLNLCYGVIFAIFSLEKDIKQNNRIRNRILKPLYHLLQSAEFSN